MYDLHRLRLLRELSLRGSLAEVARALGYSPSAVSHQLAVLERETRTELLEPAGRGVRLTSAVRALVEHTEVMLQEMERAEAAMAAHREQVRGSVRIATFQTAAHRILPPVIRELAGAHPQLEVHFRQVAAEDAVPGLLAGDFDLALDEHFPGQLPPRHPGIVVGTLAHDPMVLVSPPSWQVLSLDDAASRPWALEPRGTSARDWLEGLCRSRDFTPLEAFQSSDVHLHVELAAQGLAVACVPSLGLPTGAPVSALSLGQHCTVTVSSRAGSQRHPAIVAVREALAEQVQALGMRLP